MSIFTAKIFEADMTSFKFVFSSSAALKAILYFSIIFIIVMFFNVLSISKYKIIDFIYSKKICVPGLNCYSCPGAMGACPIGSLQAVIGSIRYNFSLYVIGCMSLLGIIFGRFICGWLCPFGLIQDLLYKIPTSKIKVNRKINNILKYLKYVILLVFVILLPLFLIDDVGLSNPYFCKYICPAGTLEGGIPLVAMNKSLQTTIGFLFKWKVTLLIITIVIAILVYRPFCRYICPLGAFYSLFNPISFYKLKVDKNKCTNCKACQKKCKMNIAVYKNPNSLECIRCGECVKACPTNAIKKGFDLKPNSLEIKEKITKEK